MEAAVRRVSWSAPMAHVQMYGYGVVQKHACTFPRPVLQRLKENRHKEAPGRLVGRGPSDDKDAFRGLRNPIGLLRRCPR